MYTWRTKEQLEIRRQRREYLRLRNGHRIPQRTLTLRQFAQQLVADQGVRRG